MRLKLRSSLLLLSLITLLVSQILEVFRIASPYIEYVCNTVVYFIVALLVWLERGQLEDVHLDSLTLLTFMLSSVFRVMLRIVDRSYFVFLVITVIAGLIILIVLIRYRSKTPKTNFRWAMIGIFWGSILIIPITIIEAFQYTNATHSPYSYPTFVLILGVALYQIAYITLIEEMLFRGFLWGYLRRAGYDESSVFWAQGVLFWFFHFVRIGTIYSFLLAIPLITFVLSKLTQRSRQIFPSLLAHTIINTIPLILLNLLIGQ